MALTRLKINGHGQVEINNCAFRRDGRIEAQCTLDTAFSESKPAENGMLLGVDVVKKVVKYSDGTLPIALNYSAEHAYNAQKMGLKDFYLVPGTFLPRLGYPAVGDKFTTNCVCYDTSEFTDESTLMSALDSVATTPVYGVASSAGAIQLTKTKPSSGLVLTSQKGTLPDGQFGVKFQVVAV